MAVEGTIPFDAEIGDKVVAVPPKDHVIEHGGHGNEHEASTETKYLKIVVHSNGPLKVGLLEFWSDIGLFSVIQQLEGLFDLPFLFEQHFELVYATRLAAPS